MEFVAVGRTEEFAAGAIYMRKVDGREIAITRVEDRFYAFSNYCSHAWAPLNFGWLEACEVVCASHGARFDIRSGESPGGRGYSPIPVYQVRVEEGQLLVERPQPPSGRPDHLRFVSVRDDEPLTP